jgi:hypothetical protein
MVISESISKWVGRVEDYGQLDGEGGGEGVQEKTQGLNPGSVPSWAEGADSGSVTLELQALTAVPRQGCWPAVPRDAKPSQRRAGMPRCR